MKTEDNQIEPILRKLVVKAQDEALTNIENDKMIPEAASALATAIGEVLKDESTTVEEGRTYDLDELMAIVRPSKERNDLREEIREALRGIGLDVE